MIAVTGTTGFMGQWVVARLTALGFDVLCISRRPTKGPSIAGLTWSKPVRSIVCDFQDPDAIKACKDLRDADTLVHLAGYLPEDTSSNSSRDAFETFRTNVIGTVQLLQALRNSSRISCLVFASTFEVYGTPQRSPIDEGHPTSPLSYYGASKLSGEKFITLFGSDQAIHVCSLRFCAIYGPGDTRRRAIGNFVRAAARGHELVIQGDGLDRRELIYAGDAANAVALAVEKRVSCIVNIASGNGYSVREMAEVVKRVSGGQSSIVSRERVKPRLDYTLAIDRASQLLGWRPSTSLEGGVQAQLAWVRANRSQNNR